MSSQTSCLSAVFPAVRFILGLPVPLGTMTPGLLLPSPHLGLGACFQEVLSEDPEPKSPILLCPWPEMYGRPTFRW